ncbi:MAG: hypothetical protein AAGI06_14330 [Pseudomonadota bacterium]
MFFGIKKPPCVAHHGLQRSGTNFLLLSLEKLGFKVLNKDEPERSGPRHKHCRWYAEKEHIPQFLACEYSNQLSANTIRDVDTLCGYPVRTRHLVIRKQADAALVSLLNWGLRCTWFSSKADALASLETLRADYERYYAFWDELAALTPQCVQIIDHEELVHDHGLLLSALHALEFDGLPAEIDLTFSCVPQSPADRKSVFSLSDLET